MTDLDQVLARFPDHASEIRRLCLRDMRFRSICEDLVLAYRSLASVDSVRAVSPTGLEELRVLRDELESELLSYLNRRRERV
jgi:hypothetical protein